MQRRAFLAASTAVAGVHILGSGGAAAQAMQIKGAGTTFP